MPSGPRWGPTSPCWGARPDREAAALVADAMAVPTPLSLGEVTAASKAQLSPDTFYAAGMAIMFLFLTVQFGVLGLLEERQNGTHGPSPRRPHLPPRAIVAGKALTSFVLGAGRDGGAGRRVHPPGRGRRGATHPGGGDPGPGRGVAAMASPCSWSTRGAHDPGRRGPPLDHRPLLAMRSAACSSRWARRRGHRPAVAVTPHAWFLRGIDTLADPAAGSSTSCRRSTSPWPWAAVTGGSAQFRIAEGPGAATKILAIGRTNLTGRLRDQRSSSSRSCSRS